MPHGTGERERERDDIVVQARALAVRCATEAGRPDLADDVALVVSELVTNAVLHGGGCTGLDISPTDSGVRVEVRDASPVRPLVGHASDEALTGRGVRMVASLAARWGAEVEPDGKVVWAEVTDEAKPESGVSEEDLLAMWGDEWDDVPDPTRFRIELGEVPTDLLLAAKAHVDNVGRELALASSGAVSGVSAELPPHLVSLLGALEAFAEARLSIKRQALDAVHRGAERTALVLDLPPSATDAADAYLQALDEIDAYSRAARLLTLETPPQHKVFRQWYVGELVTQLRAQAAGEAPPPIQPFERRLLAELDRVAAAQRTADRAARLYTVSAALATADTPEAVAAVVLDEGVAALHAAGGGLLLLTDADRLALPGAVGYDEEVVARLRSEDRDAELPAAVALRTGEAVWLESRTERDRRFPDLVGMEATTVSLCAVPLEVRDRRLGALRFSFTEARLFDDDERRFVLALAAQTAQALDRAQLHHARVDVSRRLQRSLLPPRLPDVEGIDVAATYHSFGDGVEIGGDFYDLWPVAEHRWAVVIGDAAGTGPEAAALTALVRHTLRALTLSEHNPGTLLAKLNRALCAAMAEAGGDDRFCTLIFGELTTGPTTHLALAGGGHPPVFVRRADSNVERVMVGGSLLGAFTEPDIGTAALDLHPGDLAVMLTDGVLEARLDRDLFGPERVEQVLRSIAADAGTTVAAIEDAVLTHTGGTLGDDMAVIALRVPDA